MIKSEEIYNKLVDTATEAIWSEYMKKITPPLYLYYKMSTETEAGQLLPIRQGQPRPEGFLLVTGEHIPRNVTREILRSWVNRMCYRLSLLPWHRD